ncbi:hypothetical protein, conserved [Entamoeba dispar SAW760]|uniref:AIG1-type G domain-containing protein n=1 Tax=Entamoeba dispar (strain ATCC PRA-260 / SAW760) TaxID=370354 RepID=B0EV15_ENTDS|nr:uncharacterized protein EDI_036170 [Entamoeba dispar SAW760]EDR21631.1 hypothetical protein, conserved [Entamoeba dispar SAW760]|eukprot:EDR21631.1 hypothetical protein, conserved [Entamoeba dispar SAW760]
MSVGEIKDTKMILIGGIGDGKSSLGNYILKKRVFGERTEESPKTQETVGFNGEADRKNIFVIDTPGLQDSVEVNENRLSYVIEYIKEQQGVQAIVIVLNFNKEVLSENIKTMLKLICNVFPTEGFWEHVCIVWTKCYNYTSEEVIETQIKTKKEKVLPELKKLIKETTRDGECIEFPMYFVDSLPDEGSDNARSEKEIERLLTWSYHLTPINKKRNEKPLIKYKSIETEEKEVTEVVEANDRNIKLRIDCKIREKRTGYDGEITYTEWKLKPNGSYYKTETRPTPKPEIKEPQKPEVNDSSDCHIL